MTFESLLEPAILEQLSSCTTRDWEIICNSGNDGLVRARWHGEQLSRPNKLRYYPHMSSAVAEIIGGEPYTYYPMGEHVVRADGVCGGRPTFKYTRIEITGALARLANGESLETIVAGYNGRVTRAAMLEASEIVAREFINHLPTLHAA